MRVASDEREHRRGLVLGLTMAEVLLLLLFLLLLALAANITRQGKALAEANEVIRKLGPLIGQIDPSKEITPEIVGAAAKDLASVPDLRRENEALRLALADALKREEALKAALTNTSKREEAAKTALANSSKRADALEEALVEERKHSDAFKQLEAQARKIDPNDPPAALRRGLELLAAGDNARLKERSDKLTQLEKQAQGVDPTADPQKTISVALASVRSTREGGTDAQIGGQVRERVAVLRDTEHRLNDRLNAAFGPKLKGWGAEIDSGSMVLRFQRPDVLFETGSATLKPAFQTILKELFPEYIRILREFGDDLEEVRIEGHTSSEWSSQSSDMQAYFNNMGLSQNRTRAVLEYGLTETGLPPAQVAWARKLITANGLSSSHPREVDGREDKDASRRVEFRVLTRAKEQLLKIVDPGGR